MKHEPKCHSKYSDESLLTMCRRSVSDVHTLRGEQAKPTCRQCLKMWVRRGFIAPKADLPNADSVEVFTLGGPADPPASASRDLANPLRARRASPLKCRWPVVAPNGLALEVPAIHLNGSGKAHLVGVMEAAISALDTAREALAKARPHPRDYYVNDKNISGMSFDIAAAQHKNREERLTSVASELEYLWNRFQTHEPKVAGQGLAEAPVEPTDADGGNDEGRMCDACGGMLVELGTLGRTTHYRCRQCGTETHS